MKYRVMMMVVAMVILVGCERAHETPNPGSVPPETNAQTPPAALMSNGQVAAATVAITTSGGISNVTAEIAQSDEERTRGLMGRESIPENNGMWFVFPSVVEDKFWMKDTTIPLDIIFVGSDMKVVDFISNTVPLSTELLSSRVPYQYVLEVNAGYAASHGIQVGDTVQLRSGPAE